jgi:hypothetical protein
LGVVHAIKLKGGKCSWCQITLKRKKGKRTKHVLFMFVLCFHWLNNVLCWFTCLFVSLKQVVFYKRIVSIAEYWTWLKYFTVTSRKVQTTEKGGKHVRRRCCCSYRSSIVEKVSKYFILFIFLLFFFWGRGHLEFATK